MRVSESTDQIIPKLKCDSERKRECLERGSHRRGRLAQQRAELQWTAHGVAARFEAIDVIQITAIPEHVELLPHDGIQLHYRKAFEDPCALRRGYRRTR